MNKAPDTFGAIDNLKIQEALEVGRDEDQAREREREIEKNRFHIIFLIQ